MSNKHTVDPNYYVTHATQEASYNVVERIKQLQEHQHRFVNDEEIQAQELESTLNENDIKFQQKFISFDKAGTPGGPVILDEKGLISEVYLPPSSGGDTAIYSLTLAGEALPVSQHCADIPLASDTRIGLMSKEDKKAIKKIDNLQEKIDPEHKLDYSLIDNPPEIPSVKGYATETWVNQQGFLTSRNLSGYATIEQLNKKQDSLTPGDNITIENGVISSTSTSSVLTESLTVTENVGGVTAGTVFPAGTSLIAILTQILVTSTPPVAGDKIYYAITNAIPSMDTINNPGTGEQVASSDIIESQSQYVHSYNNGTSNDPQYFSIAYPSSLGDLTSILDGINSEQLGIFTRVIDGSYNIYYLGDQWCEDDMQFKFIF